jgi:hypothetical protein
VDSYIKPILNTNCSPNPDSDFNNSCNLTYYLVKDPVTRFLLYLQTIAPHRLFSPYFLASKVLEVIRVRVRIEIEVTFKVGVIVKATVRVGVMFGVKLGIRGTNG